MIALALPDGRMFSPTASDGLTRTPTRAASWSNATRAVMAMDRLNAYRTRLDQKFELVVLMTETDICAA